MAATNSNGGVGSSGEELKHVKVEMHDVRVTVAMGMPSEDGSAPSAPINKSSLSRQWEGANHAPAP